MNQETLEEFAEREATEFYEKGTVEWNKFRQLIEVGGKWQAKISYSEEEIIPLLNALQYFINRVENGTIRSKTTYKMYKELLEQFKKK